MAKAPPSTCITADAAQMTSRGLALRTGMAFDTWLQIGRRISHVADASAWWLGDWLVYGEQAYGDRYRIALRATSLDYQTLRNYAWVARRFPLSRRRYSLSFQHHAEVAALADAEQDLWLGRAERSGWSRNELRRQLAEARRARRLDAGDPTVVYRVEVTAAHERRWRDAASASDTPLLDWIVSVVDAAARATVEAAEPELYGASPTMSRRLVTSSLQPEPVAR